MNINFKVNSVIAIILLSSITGFAQKSVNNDYPVLKGPYIGQKPPGLTPKIFAPGIPSKEYRDWGGYFSPDMKEYYVTRRHHKTGKSTKIVFKYENGRWHESVVDWGGFVSTDGKVMYSRNQYRERTGDGWSEPKSLGPLFEDFRIMRLTASAKGTYVFDEVGTNGDGMLRYSRLINGKRETPKPFNKEINTGKWTAHPFIAPDESYIIWDSERDGGYGDSDMYISFRQPDGSWGAAVNFGEKINTEGEDGGGYVTPDGKYLFYCRRCTPPNYEIMWVDAKFIDTLRAKQ
ncbi:hypothetical protein [Pleionea sp. CnH1-48]|uniref:hypothetical protein n=1 Tax=Pleionea sp. CnH1-48 TaxID=2954494 RepID=UPI0020974C2C|nr:hypothetical protein [Pleionea sp. CnH1-48]MCO7224402.1 hypothetical protein [Pleionea sp. CnH1-48]